MNDNDKKICEHTDGIVSYLYGEMPESDRNVFETHLAQCDACTDEFAGVSMARYSVYEWNKLEFAKLETPQIVIPYESATPGFSWFDKVREAMSFAHGWPVAGAGLAAVAIVFGLVMFGPDANKDNRDLAGANLNNTQSNARPIVTETPENTTAPKPDGTDPISVPAKSGGPSIERETSGRNPVPVKISDDSRDRKPVKGVRIAPRKQTRPVPSLSEFAEDEDKTLRLAEMLEDTETSE
jgi:hypothetical protein